MPPLLPFAFLLFACFSYAAPSAKPPAAQEPPSSYTDMNSMQAERNLRKITAKNPAKLAEHELAEWVRARLALIALFRLEGKEKEAAAAFSACGAFCEKHGPSAEWEPVRKWGCARSPKSAPCKGVAGSADGEKTKAPKPPL